VQLAPRPPVGVAIGAQIAQPQPASIRTAVMGTEVPRGVNGTRAAVRRGHRIGPHRRREGGSGGLWLTQAAQWGLCVRPANALGALERLRLDLMGSGAVRL
jgi:hypothetical protein